MRTLWYPPDFPKTLIYHVNHLSAVDSHEISSILLQLILLGLPLLILIEFPLHFHW